MIISGPCARSAPDRRGAILLDRDGTLIVERDYLHDPLLVELEAGVITGLTRLGAAGWRLVMISNQSGVARGYYTEQAMHAVNGALIELLAAHGVTLDGIYCCIHAPSDLCSCRKPAPGLLLRAAQELNLDLEASVMIGDKRSDLEAAANAGAAACLVTTGHGARDRDWAHVLGYPVLSNLAEAATLILDGRGVA